MFVLGFYKGVGLCKSFDFVDVHSFLTAVFVFLVLIISFKISNISFVCIVGILKI